MLKEGVLKIFIWWVVVLLTWVTRGMGDTACRAAREVHEDHRGRALCHYGGAGPVMIAWNPSPADNAAQETHLGKVLQMVLDFFAPSSSLLSYPLSWPPSSSCVRPDGLISWWSFFLFWQRFASPPLSGPARRRKYILCKDLRDLNKIDRFSPSKFTEINVNDHAD